MVPEAVDTRAKSSEGSANSVASLSEIAECVAPVSYSALIFLLNGKGSSGSEFEGRPTRAVVKMARTMVSCSLVSE